jgi:predicted RNase H-like nuclease
VSGKIVGVDGCRTGWLCISLSAEDQSPQASVVPDFASLLERFSAANCIAVDIPIGLPDTGARACDVEARERIRPRSSSVFPAPIRGILRARSYEEANQKSREISGKGFTKQAFAILPKIAEVDAALRGDAELRNIVFEVHPELCFRTWAGKPVMHPKKSHEGAQLRAALIEQVWPGAIDRCSHDLAKVGGWQNDDLIDAFAALWTARRILAGTAIHVPAVPEVDAVGLQMRMMA